ncbi:Alpha-N-acetylgalactosaminidase precursor [Fusarium agapanthi]|uniref:alpha-galactosidase n=1 Tax=Fusarium agapanthi TaxID=1803897 RepID=A0A9P5EG82_9HYPO|nr:Alpha-N-acetylgalactosaminidase precursor [Fusarium agapanthi]
MAQSWLSTLALLPLLALAESDGFGAKPVMGYNSYNDVVCSPNQTYTHDTITAMKQKGFVDLGYTMFQIDCGWFSKERAANGSLTYDNQTFPDGISPLSNACPICGWNTVYVKADNCFAPDDTVIQRYTNLSNALRDVGIDGMMTRPIAMSWRMAADIARGWDSVFRITNEAIHVILQGNSGPGHYGDMDLLEVGNPGMTQSQQATHFAIWAMFKSALMISTNVVDMPSETQAILSNTGLIAINQDDLGAPVRLIQRYPDYDVYAGPLSGDDMAVLIVDQSGNGGNYYLDFNSLNPYGSSALRLTNIQAYTPPPVTYNYIKGSSGALDNGAKLVDCSACSSGQAAGYVGGGQSDGGGSVTFTDIKTSQATQNVKIDYINSEIIYPNESGPNTSGYAPNIKLSRDQLAAAATHPVAGHTFDSVTHGVPKDVLEGINKIKLRIGNTLPELYDVYSTLQEVIESCDQDSTVILSLVSKLNLENSAGSLTKTLKLAIKLIWKTDEIQRLDERFKRSQAILIPIMARISKYVIYQVQHSRELTVLRNETQALGARCSQQLSDLQSSFRNIE